MPAIKLDGKVCEFEGSKSILDVAREHGVEIPHYCYHPGLTRPANCRICLAEVAQPNPKKDGAVDLIPKLVPACTHPAVDGAEVYLSSEKTSANQKAVMEYLLLNHPLDCPVCDQAGECTLQDFSYRYGRGFSRFEEAKIKNATRDVGPNVKLYSDRCILCTRCVRFTREVTGTGELGVFGRGAEEEIDVFPGHALNNELSGNVVDICPVGALLDKDFLFARRVWELTPTPSIDPLTAAGDNLWLDHADNRIYRARPRHNLAVNRYWTSDEIRYSWKFVHSEQRLRLPTVREMDGTRIASWSDAVERARVGLAAAGQRAGILVSPMISCEDAYLLTRAVRAIDPEAVLGIGPVPMVGEDKTFLDGYTVRAEKAPNARGVHEAMSLAAPDTPIDDYAGFVEKLRNDRIDGVLLTGNDPRPWSDRSFLERVENRFTVAIDVLPNALTRSADVVLPAATWAEKAGTFKNVDGRRQTFERALLPLELVRPEGQIGLDLLAASGESHPDPFAPAETRQEMGGPFVTDVFHPVRQEIREPDMVFEEL